MDPRQGSANPRQLQFSGAAAEMDRRRAFLQNFTPAFNIGPQTPPRVRNAVADTSRQGISMSPSTSSFSSSSSPNNRVRYGTSLLQQAFLGNRSQMPLTLANGMLMHQDPEYDELELEEEGDESEQEFDEEELLEEDVGQMELDGVDIDEVEELQPEDLEEMEAVDEEEQDEGIRYDSRYACQDEFMYDDEEYEEEFDEPLPSTSFGQSHLAGGSMQSSMSIQQSGPSISRNLLRLEEWNASSRTGRGDNWENNSDDDDEEEEEEEEDLDEIEITPVPPSMMKPQAQIPRKQLENFASTSHPPLKVKPLISPDICDSGERRPRIKNFEVTRLDNISEDSDVEVLEEKKVIPTKSKQDSTPTRPVNPTRICLSWTHDSSISSPEKRPKYTLAAPQEDSNDVDSNDFEDDSVDNFETPKTSRVNQSGGTRRAGRPRKKDKEEVIDDEDSRNLESADDSKDASRTSGTEGTRRTARTRKPPKQFVINFGGRPSSNSNSPRKGLSHEKDVDESSDKDKRLTMTFKNIRDSVTRGRSSGRARGRPRGSTAKLRTHATECMENIVQEVLSKTSNTSTDDLDEVEQTTDVEDVETMDLQSPAPSSRSAKKTPRGGRRVKTPKPAKEKNKRVSKAKPVEVLDENAMMGYAKIRDEFDNSIDGWKLGDDNTRFSNGSLSMNSPANSNLESIVPKVKKTKNFEAYIVESKPVTAETLFDYWWTRDGKSERYMLQEQVSEFVGVKAFKRKYPDLRRRVVEMEERDFLRREKIVTEVQCDLGLTALYFNDVISIMRNDFRTKYHELEDVWAQRMEMEIERKRNEVKTVERVPLKMRPEDIRKTLLRSAAEWNSSLNKDRQVNRSHSMDLQTFIIHEQKGRSKKHVLPPEMTRTGYFPTPALVGQYVDIERVPKLSPDELKYMPINTPLYGPVALNSAGDSEDSESDSDDSSSTDDTSSSSDITGKQGPSSDTDDNTSATDICTPLVVGGENNLGGAEAMNVICKSCSGGIVNNKDAVPEMIIHCTKCKVPNHPSCLELSGDMLPSILKYNWQCTDCKNCIECNDPADEDKMLFCDLCDRGYHIYCVGLRKVPTGRWHCRVCAICYSCGAKTPSEDDRLAEWHHEFKKGDKNSKFYLHSQCVNCHKLYKKGQYCPCCLKVHLKFDKGDKSLIECRTCEKWVHAECAKNKPATSGTMFGFRCDACEAAFKIRTKIRTPFGSCP